MDEIEQQFESPIALLRWAYQDSAKLERSVTRFFDKQPYKEVTEVDSESGYVAHKIRLTKTPPETWRRLTFQIICGLRHCIDQATFAAVAAFERRTINRDIYFPWAESPADLEHRMGKIPKELHPVTRRLQPYPRGDWYPEGDNAIFALRKIANPNKHRVAIRPSARALGQRFQGKISGDFLIPYEGWNAARNEFTIVLFEPDSETNYGSEVAFDIAFGEVEGIAGKPVLPLLRHFGSYARFVIEQFSEEIKKLRSA